MLREALPNGVYTIGRTAAYQQTKNRAKTRVAKCARANLFGRQADKLWVIDYQPNDLSLCTRSGIVPHDGAAIWRTLGTPLRCRRSRGSTRGLAELSLKYVLPDSCYFRCTRQVKAIGDRIGCGS